MIEAQPNRVMYGRTLVELGERDPRIVVFEADIAKSTNTFQFRDRFPERFFNCGAAELNMVCLAAGASTTGLIPFASTFCVFASMRACEGVRQSLCYARRNVKLVATNAGVEIAGDGPSHQAVEDLAIMRSLANLVVLSPSDPVTTRLATLAAAEYAGPVYMRLGRQTATVLHPEDTRFEIGKMIRLREGGDVTIIATGNMVEQALIAAEELGREGMEARVLDCHTIKPIDRAAVIGAARETGGIVTAEDHSVIGGLGGAVCEVVSEEHPVVVRRVGLSDRFASSGRDYRKLLRHYGLHAGAIVKQARQAMSCLAIGCLAAATMLASGLNSGSVYREYRVTMRGNDWRVTDPNAGHEGAAKFLPNPKIALEVGSLKDAVRAELLLDRWGGHPGTSGKKIRFNGNPWLDLPELKTTPDGHRPECYMYQGNPVVAVPLEHLREGRNILEGTSGDQVCYSFRWGQWGQNAAVLRIYYASDDPYVSARIVEPVAGANLGENPLIRVAVDNPAEVARVDVLAFYYGYDENGDGVFEDWHHCYSFDRRTEPEPGQPEISGHIGSAFEAPFEVVWDTQWVPDQPEGNVRILARVLGKDGTWAVTDSVNGLSLIRENESVRIYKPYGVGERYWVRAGHAALSRVKIPDTDDVGRAVEAAVHIRTWNGYREYFQFNGWTGAIAGKNHTFAYTVRRVPVRQLRTGEQLITFYSATKHHGVEILWPGPALTVRYKRGETH